MPDLLTHPSAEELAAFGLGILDDTASQAVLDHLGECEACQQAVAGAPGDTFTELLAGAKTILDAPTPGDELPSELASHPRYTPLRLLGVGGMGTVWLAEHALMERRVAVKVIRPEFLARPGAAHRFRREVAAAARLHHPNIVTAFDAEQAGDTHFLAMEYVDGVGLDELLKERGALSVTEACRYSADAAVGLDHAHRTGLVHRDVKPGNLMRSADGAVKVLDFGLAMLVADDRADASLTGANMVVGTPDYIAPEQAEHPHAADARADIYALGCTLYHLLTGTVPFPGSSVLKKLDAHRRDQPKPLSRFRNDIPRGLPEIVMKMMAKDPAARFPTAAAVAQALRPYADPSYTQQRQRPKRFAAVAAFLILALVTAGAVVYRIQTDKGELVISTQNDDVEVIIKQGGKLVTIIDTKTQKRVELKSGEYDLELRNAEGLRLDISKATLTRGKEVLARIERLPVPVKTTAAIPENNATGYPIFPDPMPGMPGMPGMMNPNVPLPQSAVVPNYGPMPVLGMGMPMGGPPGRGPASHWPPAALSAANKFMTRLPIKYAETEPLRFSPDSRLIGFLNGTHLELLESATGRPLADFIAENRIFAWAFTPDSSRVVIVTTGGANNFEFELWRPETGERSKLGEPIRLTTEVRGLTLQGSLDRLVLDTGGTYHVYDTKTKAIIKRLSVKYSERAGGGRMGDVQATQVTSRTVSPDGERVYTLVAERTTSPGGFPGPQGTTLKHKLRVDYLTEDETDTTVIDLPGSNARIFDVPRLPFKPATAPVFGVLVLTETGETKIRMFDALAKPVGELITAARTDILREVAVRAPQIVVTARDAAAASFETIDLTNSFKRTPIAKIPNYDALTISEDGRVFAARTETGWNLYRLADPMNLPPTPVPRQAPTTDAPAAPQLEVWLGADGELALNGQGTTLEKLGQLPAGARVRLSADKDASAARLNVVIAELRAAKVTLVEAGGKK